MPEGHVNGKICALRLAQPPSCCATRNTLLVCCMIKSIRHKVLAALFDAGSTAGVQASHAKRLRLQLAALDTAQVIDDMDIPGFRLHPLKGKLKGRWSIQVNGNWRLTFEFTDSNVHVLDYADYH